MIQIFRQNNFLSSLLLVPYTFILRLGFFWNNPKNIDMESGGVLYPIFNEAFGDSNILRFIAVNICIAFSGVLINRLLIKHRLMRNQTLLPGLTYILLSSWLEVFLPFSAIHVANYFIILTLLSVFEFGKRKSYSSSVFDASLYLSIAVLFYSPYFLFIIPVILGLMNLDRIKFNDIFAIFAGLLTPILLILGILFFLNKDLNVIEGFHLGLQVPSLNLTNGWLSIIPSVVYTILIIIGLLSYNSFVRKNSIQVHKKFNILYWSLFAIITSFLLVLDKSFIHFLTFSIPLSAFIGILWSRVNDKVYLEEFFHLLIVGGIMYLHFSTSFHF